MQCVFYPSAIRLSGTARKSLKGDFRRTCAHKTFANFKGKNLLGSPFDKILGLLVSCEISEMFGNTFFYRTTPVAASR